MKHVNSLINVYDYYKNFQGYKKFSNKLIQNHKVDSKDEISEPLKIILPKRAF